VRVLAPLTIASVGLVLMGLKILTDGEPGALPLLLVVLGATWYGVGRVLARGRRG